MRCGSARRSLRHDEARTHRRTLGRRLGVHTDVPFGAACRANLAKLRCVVLYGAAVRNREPGAGVGWLGDGGGEPIDEFRSPGACRGVVVGLDVGGRDLDPEVTVAVFAGAEVADQREQGPDLAAKVREVRRVNGRCAVSLPQLLDGPEICSSSTVDRRRTPPRTCRAAGWRRRRTSSTTGSACTWSATRSAIR